MRRLPILLALGALGLLPSTAAAAPQITTFHLDLDAGTPRALTAGPDGNVWFTDDKDPEGVARITPLGAIDVFHTGVTHDGGVREIAAGPSALWFTESNRNIISRVSTSGVVTEFP